VTLEASGPLGLERLRTEAGRAHFVLPTLAASLPVFGLAVAQGGYFPTAWGWASVPLLWAAAVALIVQSRIRISRPELVFIVALTAFAAWTALSIVWSATPSGSVLEVERSLVYVGAVLTVLVVSRARFSRHVLGGLLAVVTMISAFSLATRLAPDRVGVYDSSGVYRLAEPLGYWNGLALFSAMGALIALGFSGHARLLAARAASGACLVVLLPTMYFTFGRAAWLALAAGLVALAAVDTRRLRLAATVAAVVPLPALAVLLSSEEDALTHAGTPLALAAHDGHRLGLWLVLLAAANAAITSALAFAQARVRISRTLSRAFAVSFVVLVLGATAATFARYGGPPRIAKAAYRSFTAAPVPVEANLNKRLLSFSGNGRAAMWRLAWEDAVRHPWLGAGAGAYERYFLAHEPPNMSRVRDAHSLYVETLAELGPIGLAILTAVLATPFLVLRRARRHPLVPAALGAYVAYLVHTGVDWDWELPAVTLVGLICAAAILLTGRPESAPVAASSRLRFGVGALAVAAAMFAMVALVANTALSRSETAREHGNLSRAAADARLAQRLEPWSPAPKVALGRAELAAGLVADARDSFRKATSIDPGDWELWNELAGVTTGLDRDHALARVAALYPRSGIAPPSKSTRR
jgi:O-antigen ligase